jgi:putative DNA methylase
MTSANRPRLLIEDWLPAAAIGVECMRERGSASALAPHTYLHVWWARRPLVVARAAVLGSLLPAEFPHEVFERLLGFGKPGKELVRIRALMDTGYRVEGGFGCDRAFKAGLREPDLEKMGAATEARWGGNPTVIDPMSGGGSIPLESARMGFHTLANEYNPVACSVLEATLDYPLRFGPELAQRARKWARVWLQRCEERLAEFFPKRRDGLVHAYIFTRTVPCPETQHHTPLVPDWHLLKPKGSDRRTVAEPIVDKANGTWAVRVREVGTGAGKLREAPHGTYGDGKGVSLFTGLQIPSDYIKAKAQSREMRASLYVVAVKTPNGLEFFTPSETDLKALAAAEKELAKLRPDWERRNVIPTEKYPEVTSEERPRIYGMPYWADLFSPRQLLANGVLVDEFQKLRKEVIATEGEAVGEATLHLLALSLDKFLDYNNSLNTWETSRGILKHIFQRHDYSFKATFGEFAPCCAGVAFNWCVDNSTEGFEQIALLPRAANAEPVEITQGSATTLPQLADKSIAAVVVDPPYADNVQYSELADFFYVWLKRTQGHRRPEWFSTYLCEHTEEAVVNAARHRKGDKKAKDAKAEAHAFYQELMTNAFREAHRILRDDGALTVMFTHKKQEAWEALFTSLIRSGFTITATWPVKTESEHSLHQAKKNAAQSTVVLVARKRHAGAGAGFFDQRMVAEIRQKARATAERLKSEGLNAVDQLVGSFGPAMEVYSRWDEVRTDTGEPVGVDVAIDEASEAVSDWRVEQLAARGLDGVEAEGRFVLLCWDVLGAVEFRFNEASLLGKAVGMDVDSLIAAGLVTKSGDKINMVPVKERRRARALEPDEAVETLFGPETKGKRRKKGDVLKIHPNDPHFRTALDGCHALALRYLEAGGGAGGIGNAKALIRQQNWSKESAVARLIAALVEAAPEALHHEGGKTSAAAKFPEFRAWHALLEPLFAFTAPDWTAKPVEQPELSLGDGEEGEAQEEEGEE